MKRFVLAFVALAFMLGGTVPAAAHCEVPCGIYGDELRFDLMAEHITTIEKSMQTILELSRQKNKNPNQIVRWVNNKEEHAEKLQQVIAQYFLHQRIKPVEDPKSDQYNSYVRQLTLAHRMLVSAMKAKQTTDLVHVRALRQQLEEFRTAYFGPGHKKHTH